MKLTSQMSQVVDSTSQRVSNPMCFPKWPFRFKLPPASSRTMKRPHLARPPQTIPQQKSRRTAQLANPSAGQPRTQSRREVALKPNDHLARVLAENPEIFRRIALELPTALRLLHSADETDSDATSEDAEEAGRRTAALTRRSRRRIHQALKTAMEKDLSRRELLEVIAVTPKVERYYKLSLSKFILWADEQRIGLTSDSSVDIALTRYMTELYLCGHQSSEGDKLLAALLHFAPEWGKFGHRSIPRAWRSLRGWRRRCPSRSRRP